MSKADYSWLVALRGSSDPVGSGLLVGPRHVLTCRHVAVGLEAFEKHPPVEDLYSGLRVADGPDVERVVAFHASEDLALLELSEPIECAAYPTFVRGFDADSSKLLISHTNELEVVGRPVSEASVERVTFNLKASSLRWCEAILESLAFAADVRAGMSGGAVLWNHAFAAGGVIGMPALGGEGVRTVIAVAADVIVPFLEDCAPGLPWRVVSVAEEERRQHFQDLLAKQLVKNDRTTNALLVSRLSCDSGEDAIAGALAASGKDAIYHLTQACLEAPNDNSAAELRHTIALVVPAVVETGLVESVRLTPMDERLSIEVGTWTKLEGIMAAHDRRPADWVAGPRSDPRGRLALDIRKHAEGAEPGIGRQGEELAEHVRRAGIDAVTGAKDSIRRLLREDKAEPPDTDAGLAGELEKRRRMKQATFYVAGTDLAEFQDDIETLLRELRGRIRVAQLSKDDDTVFHDTADYSAPVSDLYPEDRSTKGG